MGQVALSEGHEEADAFDIGQVLAKRLNFLMMQQVFDTMSEATGVDFREILKAQTYDAKVNHNLNLTGIPESVKITPEPIKKAPETVDTTEKTAPEPTE